MVLYRISSCNYISSLDGTGARLYGSRWNSKGVSAVFMASSMALAVLEVLVHVQPLVSPINFCSAEIQVPDDSILTLDIKTLPDNWADHSPPASLKEIGNKFIKEGKYLTLKVPSAIVPEEANYILNPFHTDSHKVKITRTRPFSFDKRFTIVT